MGMMMFLEGKWVKDGDGTQIFQNGSQYEG